MANPTPYERGYSFAGFQANNPQKPLPGQKVDEELDNLERTTTDLISGLADIRRSDGALRNGIVTKDALAPGLVTGVDPATEWKPSQQYFVNNAVFYDTAFYRCLEGHVSGLSFPTDFAAGKWELYAELGGIVDDAAAARDQAVLAAASSIAAKDIAVASASTATTAAGTASTAATTAVSAKDDAETARDEAEAAAATATAKAATVINGFQKRVRYSDADGNLANGQTVFTVAGGYDPQEAEVTRNGLVLANGVDVDVSSGTTFTLTAAVGVSDVVLFKAFGVFNANSKATASTPDTDDEKFSTPNDVVKRVPTATWAQPIGRYGSGAVPANLTERFRHVCNAKTDFGVQLYNNASDTGGGVKDNRPNMQAAIDAAQRMGGAVFVPPDERSQAYSISGGLVLRDSDPDYIFKSVGIVGISPGDWTRGLRNGSTSGPAQYSFGCGLRLADGSDAHIISSPERAGHLYLEDIMLDGNWSNQTGSWRGVSIEDAISPPGYTYGLIAKNVNITGCGGAGVYAGLARAMNLWEDLWVQYCGEAGVVAAVVVNSYDSQIIRPGFGENRGTGLYVGATAQFELSGGALWGNDINLEISSAAMSVNVTRVHFDGALKHNVIVNRYTAADQVASRTFVQPMFSRRPNAYVNNSYDDISTNDNALVLIAPQFMGQSNDSPITSASKRSRYAIGFFGDDTGRVMVSGELFDFTPVSGGGYRSAYSGWSNNPERILRMGPMSGFENRLNGLTTVRTRADFDYFLVQHNDGTFVGGFTSGPGGKGGVVRTWDAAGAVTFSAGYQALQRARWSDLPVYASDAAAGSAGLVEGDLYILSATRAITSKS